MSQIRVLSLAPFWIFKFCNYLSFWDWSQYEFWIFSLFFLFCCKLFFLVLSIIEFLGFVTANFYLVFSQFEFEDWSQFNFLTFFVTIWVYEFCQNLSFFRHFFSYQIFMLNIFYSKQFIDEVFFCLSFKHIFI